MSTFKEIRGTLIKSLSSDPSPVANGDIWYNSTSQTLKGVQAVAAWSSGGNLPVGKQGFGGKIPNIQPGKYHLHSTSEPGE